MQNLFGQGDLVGAAFGDDGVLRVVREEALDIGHRAYRVDDFLEFLRRADVGEIEDLGHLLLVVAPLVDVVQGDEDGVGGKRLPVALGDHRQIIQRLFEGGVLEFHRYGLRVLRILRVPNHVKTSHLGDGFKQQFGGTRHAQVDRVGVDCPQLGNRQDAVDAVFRLLFGPFTLRQRPLLGVGFSPRLLHPLAFPLDHFGGAADFLSRHRRTRIDRVGLLEFDQGFPELSRGT